MTGIGNSITTAFDEVWHRFVDRLAGMSDEEYFWEPVEGCWSLRQDAAGRWRLDGGGGGGPAPEPVPVTTIAWRIGHVGGLALGGFVDRMFADGSPGVEDIEFPHRAADAVGFLERNYQEWLTGIQGFSDERWWQPLGPNWGPYAESTTVDLAFHVLDEVVHHAAEVSLLRDLYGYRDQLGGRK